ncbi:mannan endo-1,4-beta-mannosidase [Mangrovibacterium diazotrophicum]|uniref:Mannan endo-1,4-beta-mannosidase n=2 Tax=Mangrovibacterium diazotrophicum TaxID=1261403 RepID=A0A419VYE4_9BACT|nr:mannan endo-1,4-beta-mannosidase [Mangrovibacterium diazotrophicum]
MALSLILLFACSDGSEETIKDPPVFKSSIPADKEENVSPATQIVVNFNEVVYLTDNHGITLNGNAVDVEESYTKILINAVLLKGEEYVVNIPKGALINMDGVLLAEAIQFSFSTEASVSVNLKQTLAVANPSAQAVNVFNFLLQNYGSKIVSAAMANVSWNTNEADWVYQHTSKYPAMTTFDYVHLQSSPANWIDYSQTAVVEDWWNNKGLVAAGWHWNVPVSEGSETISFYTENNSFSAADAVVSGTWENAVIEADLAKMAGYLKLLQAKNIPVIWRPLHEAAGNIYEYAGGTAWFWWGADGAEAYKSLWIYMFNYFEAEGLNNLIWVWTTQTKDDAFYPGDTYVDIVGRDIYNQSSASVIAAEFASIQETYSNKMITLSECGSVSTIPSQWSAGAQWSYFMPWYDYNRTNDPSSTAFSGTDHQHANAAWWISAMGSSTVITRQDMPSLK